MSDDAVALKKQQTEDMIEYSPDAVDCDILDGPGGSVVRTIPGIFAFPVQGEDARQMGAVEWHKRRPTLTIYTGNSQYFTNGTTWVKIDGVEYKVRERVDDQTPGCYLTVLWLV